MKASWETVKTEINTFSYISRVLFERFQKVYVCQIIILIASGYSAGPGQIVTWGYSAGPG